MVDFFLDPFHVEDSPRLVLNRDEILLILSALNCCTPLEFPQILDPFFEVLQASLSRMRWVKQPFARCAASILYGLNSLGVFLLHVVNLNLHLALHCLELVHCLPILDGKLLEVCKDPILTEVMRRSLLLELARGFQLVHLLPAFLIPMEALLAGRCDQACRARLARPNAIPALSVALLPFTCAQLSGILDPRAPAAIVCLFSFPIVCCNRYAKLVDGQKLLLCHLGLQMWIN